MEFAPFKSAYPIITRRATTPIKSTLEMMNKYSCDELHFVNLVHDDALIYAAYGGGPYKMRIQNVWLTLSRHFPLLPAAAYTGSSLLTWTSQHRGPDPRGGGGTSLPGGAGPDRPRDGLRPATCGRAADLRGAPRRCRRLHLYEDATPRRLRRLHNPAHVIPGRGTPH
eukprot:8512893-Pyramimonas_sp.AAC.2